MGLSGGEQSGNINSSHPINEELARSDWMGLSGGDQSGRINSSDSIIEELARFARSDWMGLSVGDQSGRINPHIPLFRNLRASRTRTEWDCRVMTSPGE